MLAGKLGTEDLSPQLIVGPAGPDVQKHPVEVPALSTSKLQPVANETLTFQTTAEGKPITFVPFSRLFGERYSVYWQVS